MAHNPNTTEINQAFEGSSFNNSTARVDNAECNTTRSCSEFVSTSDVAAESVSRSLLLSTNEYRVAAAQISTHPGHIEKNTEKILDAIHRARAAGAQLVAFPELTIPGYLCMDLMYNPNYVADNLAALHKIRAASEGITVIVGFIDPAVPAVRLPGGRPLLYNAAAIIRDGKIIEVQHKSLLPTYEIFDEARYFAPGSERKVIDVGGIKLGVTICEDTWSEGYPVDPSKELAEKGAELIVNISASPFQLGKFPIRAGVVRSAAERTARPLLYTNLVGGYDGYEAEILFDGRSMAFNGDGSISGSAKPFGEDLMVVDIVRPKRIDLPDLEEMTQLHDALVMGIRDYFARRSRISGRPIPKAIIGLSGGIDSALVAALCAEALGRENVLGVTMPSRYSSNDTKGDAYQLAQNLGIQIKTIPIEHEVEAVASALRCDPEFAQKPEDVTEENIQARIRTVNLMALANKLGGMMVNTGNKTELIMNNCTIYGDLAGGLSVLGDVDKDRVYELSNYINRRAGRELIPQSTISRVPSAELKPGQTDALVMGAAPHIVAPVARAIFERGLTLSEARTEFRDQLPLEVIQNIFVRNDSFEWKSRQMPPALRVSTHAYGIGRRIPMDHGYYK